MQVYKERRREEKRRGLEGRGSGVSGGGLKPLRNPFLWVLLAEKT